MKGEGELAENSKNILANLKGVIGATTGVMKGVLNGSRFVFPEFLLKLNIIKDSNKREREAIKRMLEEFLGEEIERIKIEGNNIGIAGYDSAELQSRISKQGEGYKISYRVTERFLEVLGKIRDMIGEDKFNELLKGIVEHEKLENAYKIRFMGIYQKRYGEGYIEVEGKKYRKWEYYLGKDAHEFALGYAGKLQSKISINFEKIEKLIKLEEKTKEGANKITEQEKKEAKGIIAKLIEGLKEEGIEIDNIYKVFPNLKKIVGADTTGINKREGFNIGTDIYDTKETGIDSGRYKKICAIPVKFIKSKEGKDGKIIRGEEGKDIFKASAYYDKELDRIVFRFIGRSKEAIEELIKKEELDKEVVSVQINKVLRSLLIDRLAIDSVVRDDLERITEGKNKFRGIDYKKAMEGAKLELKEIGYKGEEIEELLTYSVKANTYVDLKDAEVVISNKTRLEEVIGVNKRAGVSKVVLVKGRGIGGFSEEQIEQIRLSGLEVVIGINEKTEKKEIDRYKGMEGVSGFRILGENKVITTKEIEEIMEEGKEISYKVGKGNIGKMEEIEEELRGKVIYVIEAEAIEEIKRKGELKEIQRIAKEEGRVSIYFKTDREEDIKKAKEIIEDIYGKGVEAAKTMISVGTAYIENGFGKLFNKDGATSSFSEGYEIGYEGIFGEEGTIGYVSPETLIENMKGLLTGEMSYEEFQGELEGIKGKGIMTERLELKIKEILEDKGKEAKEKMAMLRQYIIGSIVSYIEDNMDKIYEKEIDINSMKMEEKKQIVYGIMQAMVRGKSIGDIRKEIEEAEKRIEGKEGTLAELVKDVLASDKAKEISKQWNKTDMVIEGTADFEAIMILLNDNIKPVSEIAKMTVDVLKGVRATLSAA